MTEMQEKVARANEGKGMSGYCCKEFEKNATRHQPFAASGLAYSEIGDAPTGQIERDCDGEWSVNGCCGGGCYVLTNLKYCPFCGTKLAA